jgi:hypothetical protein
MIDPYNVPVFFLFLLYIIILYLISQSIDLPIVSFKVLLINNFINVNLLCVVGKQVKWLDLGEKERKHVEE